MANPNIVNINTINGKTHGQTLTTSAANIVTNASGSNKIFKINSIVCANIDGVNDADASVSVFKNQSSEFFLVKTVAVPKDATLVVLSRDTGIYLEENDSIRALASAASDIDIVIAYEEIS